MEGNQEFKQKSGEYSDKLDRLYLLWETRLLIDHYANKHNANGSYYGVIAYHLNFSDCRVLFLRIMPFLGIKEVLITS